MATMTLRVPDELHSEVDEQSRRLGVGRAEHVRRTLVPMKADTDAARLRKRADKITLREVAEALAEVLLID